MQGQHLSMIQRQVALVSYGSQFLRKELALDDWYRHGIFFGARLQFRDRASKALLADDFTLWLGSLAQGGATRLSLHPATALGVDVPPELARCEHVVVAHFTDRYQLWVVGEERAGWGAGGNDIPNAASYAGDVDCYLCLEEREGELEVPHTDWKKLAAAIASDLDIAVPSGAVPAEPFCAYTREDAPWAKMPLFVASGIDSLAHRVMATLDWEQGKFDNDTHPRNDNSYYQHLNEEDAAAVDHWGERLNSWIGEVLLRAANIGGDAAAKGDNTPLVRVSPPPPPRQSMPTPVLATAADASAAAVPTANGKWTNRLGLALGIVVLSVLIVALAKVIAQFPWLAALFALPWALYMHYKD